MASRDAILDHLAEHLQIDRFRDYNPQGLQVEGNEEVTKVATGVSASIALFEKAHEAGADLILVHHGMFWKSEGEVVVKGPLARRLRFLLENGITLAGYHLPLDAHAELGNNAIAARELGLVDLVPWAEADGVPIGWRGRFGEPVKAKDLFRRIEKYYGREPLVFPYGPDPVRTLGVVSGGAQSYAREAIRIGLDCFVTGEASEWVMSAAHEAGIHYVGAGHYATERVGIRALGEHVAHKFGVPHVFIDVPNPV